MADNVDHNIRTIDGLNTFHGMGMIVSVTPGTQTSTRVPRVSVTPKDVVAVGRINIRHLTSPCDGLDTLRYEVLQDEMEKDRSTNLDLLWIKLSLTLRSPRPAWSGMMQAVHTGVHPGVYSLPTSHDRHEQQWSNLHLFNIDISIWARQTVQRKGHHHIWPTTLVEGAYHHRKSTGGQWLASDCTAHGGLPHVDELLGEYWKYHVSIWTALCSAAGVGLCREHCNAHAVWQGIWPSYPWASLGWCSTEHSPRRKDTWYAMPTCSQAKDDGTQGTVGDDEPSEDEIMQSIDDAQAAMDPHDTESGSLDILRLQRFSRKVSTSIVVWPTTSCFADWSKRRHVTLRIIDCQEVALTCYRIFITCHRRPLDMSTHVTRLGLDML